MSSKPDYYNQQLDKLDGATAYQLIERHADNWTEVREMMEAWRSASRAATGTDNPVAKVFAAQGRKHQQTFNTGDHIIHSYKPVNELPIGTKLYTRPATDTGMVMDEKYQQVATVCETSKLTNGKLIFNGDMTVDLPVGTELYAASPLSKPASSGGES